MNKERVLLVLIAMLGVYFAGYYQITPMYLYSLVDKSKPVNQQSVQVPNQSKPSQAKSEAKGAWPAPEDAK